MDRCRGNRKHTLLLLDDYHRPHAAISAWFEQNKFKRCLQLTCLPNPSARKCIWFRALKRVILGLKCSHVDSFREAICTQRNKTMRMTRKSAVPRLTESRNRCIYTKNSPLTNPSFKIYSSSKSPPIDLNSLI